ncbi:MAG: gliding motility-associated C-terminal domain-containing protein [Opitutaceae bacterium]|nr:gliding motility-associated C-terminal domain-containing protein [Cytophagales bacterium]
MSNGNKVYFRVVAAANSATLTAPGSTFNLLNPCRNYSVSDPIEATIDCPLCVTPTTIKVENGATTVVDKGIVNACEGTQISLNLSGNWPAPAAALTDKNFEFYVINKTSNAELWKSTPPINGGTNGNAKYNIAAPSVITSLGGDYVIGIRNATCKLEQTVTIKVNSKIKNNAITADQNICAGGTSAALSQDAAKTLTGDLDSPAYQWQSSTTSITSGYTDVAGTSASYTPTGLTQTTYFRRIAKAKGGFCADSISKAVTIKVDQPITAAQNSVSTTSPIICSGNAPVVTGLAILNATYVWEQSDLASGPWTPVSGGTSKDLPSNPLTNTASGTTKSFFFHRIATLGKCTHTSSAIEVKVSGGMTAGEISKDTSVCKDGTTIPPKFTSISPATGGTTPPILYEWEVSDDGSTNWTSLGAKSASNLEYTPATVPAKDLFYRRKAYAGSGLCDNATSKTVKVSLVVPPFAEILAPIKVTSSKPENWTFNDLVLKISATPATTGYSGAWALNSIGKLDSPINSSSNSVSGMNYDDKSILTWTVKDTKGRCTPNIATLNIERKNITVANAQDDSLCETGLPYKLIGNGLITKEVSRWSFVSSTPSVPITFTLRNDSTQIALINSVNFPPNTGKVELVFRYAVKSPLLNDSSYKTVKIIVYEKAQVASVLNSPINTCASQVKIEGNKPLQPSATGTWNLVNGQGTVENLNRFITNLKELDNVGTTNLTWTINNHLCKAPSAPLEVNQKGKSTDARFSISGGAYLSKEVTNALDVPLCAGVAYTLSSILPSTGLKGTETATWSSTSTSTIIGSINTVSLAPSNEGLADAQWAIDPHILGCPPSTATATFKIGDVPKLDPISGKNSLCEGDTAHYKATLTNGLNVNILGAASYDWNVLQNVPSATGQAKILGTDNLEWVEMKFGSSSTTLNQDQVTITLTASNECGKSANILTKIVDINLTPRIFTGDIKGDSLLCQSVTGVKNYTIQSQFNTTETIWTLGGLPVSTTPLNSLTTALNATDITSKFPSVKLKIQLKNNCGLGVDKTKVIDIIEAVPVKANLTGIEKVCLPKDALVYTGSTPNGGSGATFAFKIIHKDGTAGNSQPSSIVNTFPVNVGELLDGDKIELNVTGDPISGCFSGNGIPASLNIDGYIDPDTTVFKENKFQPDSICTGDAIELCVHQTKGNVAYQWFKDDIKTSVTSNCIKLTNSWESGKYRVKIDNKVCPADSSYDKAVKIYDSPVLQIIPEDITIELAVNPTVSLIGLVNNNPTDSLTQIEWGAEEYLSTTSNPLVVTITPPVIGGDFYYILKVATGEGRAYCPATALAHVKALPPVIVPNAFTPNGDGLNDKWHIEGIDTYSNAKVYLYNRWGTQVFKANPYGKGNEWDGTTNGVDLPTGTYYYVIELHEDTQFQKPKMSGAVTIIR